MIFLTCSRLARRSSLEALDNGISTKDSRGTIARQAGFLAIAI
jgi:hypothetical protein